MLADDMKLSIQRMIVNTYTSTSWSHHIGLKIGLCRDTIVLLPAVSGPKYYITKGRNQGTIFLRVVGVFENVNSTRKEGTRKHEM